ncbi:30S ribosomal protein S14 [endosymbiont of Pachyrhynchus infernalis]|uniref:30S ribosomal protein S14 n=1 Tax=endosymbiont of Pachyrhynchus infernalis TaxID=1971488 RepID=UPI000DC722C8|nr:30S ribosomal protein S14 [endosymbiont of Pachyrhynchus infernalis]BBA84845.1 30S ribosomal protein S14 [endosymbiont of Pachyrhynchus infernalis]
MSKKSVLLREYKRKIMVNKFFNKRMELKKKIISNLYSKIEKWNFILKLQKFPKNSIMSRLRNRCINTGRPRGFIRRFGLSRLELRKLAVKGFIPGLKKSSW